MTRPNRFLFRMIVFLMAVAAVAGLLHEGLQAAFSHNPALNGLLLGVFLSGIILNFRQVLLLRPEVDWLESWRRGQPALSGQLRLLAPMASMLGERRDRMNLSAMALRSVLDSIAARLEEQRDLSRYVVGLMIFLGLLGTFWGLSETVGSVGEVIASLAVSSSDPSAAFEGLKAGLAKPLNGMGTAFSTSLFGLAGSLALGFLDLQSGQAQNAFYNELEEWLAGQTRIGGSGGPVAIGDDQQQSVPAYIQALLEQTADSLDNLQRVISRGEENRGGVTTSLTQLTEKLSTLTDHMRAEQALLLKLGEGQMENRALMAKLLETAGAGGADETTRGHIRAMDGSLKRLVDETVASREELVAQFRAEIRLLARTIAAIAEEPLER
ncbi:flagellar motor protein MotA [Paramagnetospirillum kuznetsovii]|uniref:Flagellar motor protein MotA n=1 Tax=Paramagnetospirillum kuznetsovii TaxID=2053833 RepID=A0A364NTN6_9PROT|nr:flagellar motor protein MotA [Paramagnetospirillum kuznetsovii]RAU20412.1 flagellar motor protein MotA [Paramagnetospirillum kuznetsovii]